MRPMIERPGMDQHRLPRPRPLEGMAAEILGAVAQDVGGMMLDGGKGGGILEDDHPRPHRHIELLVGVDGDRIGPFDAGEEVAVALGKEGRPAPGGIDVEMAAKLAGKIGHRLQRIDIAGFGGAGDADQRQRADVLVPQAAASLPSAAVRSMRLSLVGLDHHQIVPADAEQIGGLAEGIMPAL